ncbi:hypothetical protein M9458_011979 [Cirrhinus mrigala]|uniref:Uncharacterized protein n=1 Tax=Cirrhinus mrigala TaxID=683832 RepID=A0ABD0R725_CIRMR
MDVSGERMEEASIHEVRQYGEISNCNNREVFSKHESLLKIRSAPNTPAEDSFVHSVRRKKRQVITDTDEEDEKEESSSEKPCLTSSPLVDGLNRLGTSTPKSTLTDSGWLRRSLNTSVASRRSFVVSILENESDEESEDKTKSYEISISESHADESVVEEEEPSGDQTKSFETSEASETYADESVVEEEEPSGDQTKSYEISETSESHVEEEEANRDRTNSNETSEANETYAEESAVEEEEPSGETLNTEESESHEELEAVEASVDSGENQEQEEWHSTMLESTADVELDSNETMDQWAPKTFLPETHVLPVSTTSNDGPAAKPSENTYEMLVLSGKQCLTEGKKQEALDFFLKAIDINTGDAEIQLLIIQLYRQLSQ